MSLAALFWTIYIVLVIFGALPWFGATRPDWRTGGASFVVLVLIAILGYQVFGAAIK